MVIIISMGTIPSVFLDKTPVNMSPASNRKTTSSRARILSISVAIWAMPPRFSTCGSQKAGMGSNALSKSLVKSSVTSLVSTEVGAPVASEWAQPEMDIATNQIENMSTGCRIVEKKSWIMVMYSVLRSMNQRLRTPYCFVYCSWVMLTKINSL